MKLTSAVELVDHSLVVGYVTDLARPGLRFVVDVEVDGEPICVARADRFSSVLANRGVGDGCYGFAIRILPEILAACGCVVVRLANSGTIIGEIKDFANIARGRPDVRGVASWKGGRLISGWLTSASAAKFASGAPLIRVRHAGAIIADTSRSALTYVDEKLYSGAALRFEVWLPNWVCDGLLRSVDVLDPDDAPLTGSPVTFAVARSAEAAPALRGSLSSGGREFAEGYPVEEYTGATQPSAQLSEVDRVRQVLVVTTGPAKLEPTIVSLAAGFAQPTEIVSAEPSANGGEIDPTMLLEQLKTAKASDAIIVCRAGFRFAPDATARIHKAIVADSRSAFALCDYETVGIDGTTWPVGLPSVDQVMMAELGLGVPIFATGLDALRSALSDGNSSMYGLAQSCCRHSRSAGGLQTHLPGAVGSIDFDDIAHNGALLAEATAASERATGQSSEVQVVRDEPFPLVRIRRKPPPACVTLVLLADPMAEHLAESLAAIAAAPQDVLADVIVISTEGQRFEADKMAVHAMHRDIQHMSVAWHMNYAARCNAAGGAATSNYLCFMRAGYAPIGGDFFAELVGRCLDTTVAIAAPATVTNDGVIVDCGFVLSDVGGCLPFGEGHHMQGTFQFGQLGAARRCSAIGRQCLLTRRDKFLAAGGFDAAAFPNYFPTADYCLRQQAEGYQTIVTPHVHLADRRLPGSHDAFSATGGRAEGIELDRLMRRWGKLFAVDPNFSPLYFPVAPLCGVLRRFNTELPHRIAENVPARPVPAGF